MSEALFGRFVLIRPVKKGGLGQLSIAWDTEKSRLVALKRAGSKSGDAAARFADEVTLTQRLAHPNLVRALDTGHIDGVGWLSLERIDGQDLETLLERARKYDQRLPLSSACAIADKVLAALEYAHAQSVVHRDISPRNVMVGYDGQVHLIDFGLALSQVKSTRTLPGIAPGTVGFLAPEQREGRTVAQSDLYAVGALIWFALTGTPFFGDGEDGNSKDQFRQRLHGLAGDLPPNLSGYLWRALQKSPTQRFASAHEMRGGLVDAMGTTPAPDSAVASFVTMLFPVEQKMASDEEAGCRARYGAARSTMVIDRNEGVAQQPRKSWPYYLSAFAGALVIGEVIWLVLHHPPLPQPVPIAAPIPVVTPIVEPSLLPVTPPQARAPHPIPHPHPIPAAVPVVVAPSQPPAPAPRVEVARTMVARAETKLREADYGGAIELANSAIELGATNDAYLVRGYAELRAGRNADARRDFHRVLTTDSGNAAARAGLKSLEEHK